MKTCSNHHHLVWPVAGMALLFVGLAFSPAARADIFAGPNVSTQKQLEEKEQAFRTKTMVEAFKVHGEKNAGWNADALKFLQDRVKFRAWTGDTPGAVELEREGRLVYLKNCQDPMVLFAYGQCLVAKGWRTQAEWFMRRSAETMSAHGYSATWRAAAAAQACFIMNDRGDRDGAKPYAQMIVAAIPEMLKSADYGKDDRALLVGHIYTAFQVLSAEQKKEAWEAARKVPDADQVAVLLLEGAFHVAAGWESRGGGWSGNVTQNGWKGFEAEMADATTALTKAWDLDHTIPQPATMMIGVAMASAGPAEMRAWFDRAVQAQFDYQPAYHAYLWGLYPRWHGDRQALLDFGLECLHTKRYDTIVPLQFLEVLLAVRDECDNGDMTAWARLEVYEPLKEMLDKSLEAGGFMPDNAHYRALEAALCVQAGRCDDAMKVLEHVKGPLPASGTRVLHVTPDEVLGAANVFGRGDESAAALKASALAADGKRKEAVEAYEAVMKEQKSPVAVKYLHGLVQVLQWEQDFADGKEVSLKADEDLTGFHPGIGEWRAKPDGSIAATGIADENLDLVCEADFGEHWELHATVDFVKRNAGWSATGFTLAPPGSTMYIDYTINGEKGFASRGRFREGQAEQSATVHDNGNELILFRDGLNLSMTVNGKEVFHGHTPNDDATHRLRIGLGGWPFAKGDVVKFRDVKVKPYQGK